MNNLLKKLFSDSAAFAFSTMGNKLVAFLLAPVYISYLAKDEFAAWDQTNAYTLILTYLCILGTDAAMAYYFFDAKELRERRIYLSNALLFSSLVCIVIALIMYFIGEYVNPIVYGEVVRSDYKYLLFIATMATLGAIVIQHLLAYARYMQKKWLFNFFSMGYVIGSNLLSLWFVVYDSGIVGLFYGQLIGQITIAIILMILFRSEFILQFSKKHLTNLIKYGAPLVPTLISFWAITAIGRSVLVHIDGSQAALYSGALRVASMIVLITAPFQLAWRPFAMSIKSRDDAKRIYSLVGRILLVIGTLSIMVMTFFIKDFSAFYLKKLAPAYPYIWILSLGTLLNVLHTVFAVGLLINKQTKKISKAFLIASLIYVLGCLFLILLYKLWGAVAMTLISYFLVILLVYKQNQKVYAINFRFPSIVIYLCIYIAVMTGITWLQLQSTIDLWRYDLLALCIMIVSVFVSGLFSIRSLGLLKRLIIKK
ncbi:oligosaccharide flippase family protein [Hazenella sp. IB182353]|uniref:lipopolysaccharide biosynthesis protein n=1 Tax=Polycladospora coralii TaxID=2771432 RepID=UPI001745CD70|nr:oligosaccharide flippase family protein [Polycladospora coralii]MBS7531604.1 oligosaccharide flippase family protein [Polycladospora coralii]